MSKEKRKNKMPEGITAENLLNNIMDTFSDGAPKHKSASFFQEESESSVSAQLNRLFGRQKPIHHCLGGGKCTVVLCILFLISSWLYSNTQYAFLDFCSC